MRSGRLAKFVFCLFLTSNAPLYGQPSNQLVAPRSIDGFQGGIVRLQVTGHELAHVEGNLGKEKISFYASERGVFTALIGIDLEAAPGRAKLLINATSRRGAVERAHVIVNTRARQFQQESFSVPKEFEPFEPETLERIGRDRQQFSAAFRVSFPQRLWQGPFLRPVPGDVTSPFGFRRIINGTPRAPHTGVDLRAPSGTAVLAANRGRVALVGDFFFNGRSLVLDHGGGLYTMYFHLSEVKVEAGMEVSKGEVIALSGMSGRVTGPHLHWGARINGARVDPFALFDIVERRLDHKTQEKARIDGGEH